MDTVLTLLGLLAILVSATGAILSGDIRWRGFWVIFNMVHTSALVIRIGETL